jgi:hypothetical protein
MSVTDCDEISTPLAGTNRHAHRNAANTKKVRKSAREQDDPASPYPVLKAVPNRAMGIHKGSMHVLRAFSDRSTKDHAIKRLELVRTAVLGACALRVIFAVAQEGRDHLLILFRLLEQVERSTGRRLRDRRARNSSVRCDAAKRGDRPRSAPPMSDTTNRAETRTRRVDQHERELIGSEWQRIVGGAGTTDTFVTPHADVRISRRTRLARTSIATTVPDGPTAADKASFPPGDAQRSRTRSPALTSASSPINCDACPAPRIGLVEG